MKRQLLAIVGMVFLFISALEAQEVKLGKYSQEELEMAECSFEPEASAVVLGEQGLSYFSNSQLITEIKRRIKIFDANAKEHADIRISYYKGDNNLESISGLKAQVMNYENGKEEIIKMSKKDFFETEVGNGYAEIRFTFPNVKQGSIIEYEYKLYEKSITFLDGWTFQNRIPTMFSRYEIDIPEYLDYRFLGQGQNFVLADQERLQGNKGAKWTLTDLRSTKPEPHMENYVDYLDKVEFQLAGYKSAEYYGGYKSVLSTWQKLSDELFSIPDFDSYFKNNGTFKDLQELNVEGKSEKDKAEYLYQLIKDSYTLNDGRGFVPSQSMKNLVEAKIGSLTDLNLLFIAMLRANGIQAYPVLISGKGNGRSYLVQFPFVRQFNRLIVKATIDGQDLFADLSGKYVPLGYLPMACHVEGGFLVHEKESKLINIDLPHRSGVQQMVDVTFHDDSVDYKHVLRFMDYDAISFLQRSEDIETEDLKKYLELEEETTLSKFNVEELESDTKKVQSTFNVTRAYNGNDELLLVNPIMVAKYEKNPFKVDERNFPVDFNYVFSDNYIANIKIPEGYELDDFPEKMAISMEGGLAKFIYMPQEDTNNNMLRINIMIDLKTKMVQPESYQGLKAFMEFMVNKIQEPVVFKKKSGA